MDLPTQQRQLLGLFRSTYSVSGEDDPYIQRVAKSRDLEEGRRNIFLWRVWVLERTAALTFALLKQRKLLQEAVATFISARNISPLRETQAPAFLELLSTHRDSLVAAVARFELALMKVRQGDSGCYVIPWSVGPHSILHSLACNLPLPAEVRAGTWLVQVSRELPSQFTIFPDARFSKPH